jgi:hypothetical protein
VQVEIAYDKKRNGIYNVKEFYELEECEIRERDLRGLRNAETKVHFCKQRFFTIRSGLFGNMQFPII